MNELTQTSPTEIFLKTSTMADIKLQAQRASEMVGAVRAKMLAPSAQKNSPVFIQKEVAERCGLEPGQFSYRMKNTDLPLSIAFLADDGTIVNIEDMAPQTEDNHCPKAAIRYALEMNKGWFAQKGIKSGAKIGGLPQAR